MTLDDIKGLSVEPVVAERAHLYLWVPNALLPEGLAVMSAWGFQYKSNLVWHKVRKDGGLDGRGVGFYFGDYRLKNESPQSVSNLLWELLFSDCTSGDVPLLFRVWGCWNYSGCCRCGK